MRIKQISLVIVSIFLLFALTSLHSSEMPFKFAGTINSIHSDQIVLSDLNFKVADEVKVYSAAKLPLSFTDLKVGDVVGCNFNRIGKKEWELTEIYKVPETFDLEEYGFRMRALYTQ